MRRGKKQRPLPLQSVTKPCGCFAWSEGVFSKPPSTKLNLKQVSDVVNYILDEILTNPTVLYNLMDLKNHDNYYYLHSVNVALFRR